MAGLGISGYLRRYPPSPSRYPTTQECANISAALNLSFTSVHLDALVVQPSWLYFSGVLILSLWGIHLRELRVNNDDTYI